MNVQNTNKRFDFLQVGMYSKAYIKYCEVLGYSKKTVVLSSVGELLILFLILTTVFYNFDYTKYLTMPLYFLSGFYESLKVGKAFLEQGKISADEQFRWVAYKASVEYFCLFILCLLVVLNHFGII